MLKRAHVSDCSLKVRSSTLNIPRAQSNLHQDLVDSHHIWWDLVALERKALVLGWLAGSNAGYSRCRHCRVLTLRTARAQYNHNHEYEQKQANGAANSSADGGAERASTAATSQWTWSDRSWCRAWCFGRTPTQCVGIKEDVRVRFKCDQVVEGEIYPANMVSSISAKMTLIRN